MDYLLAKRLKEAGFPQTGLREAHCLACFKSKTIECFDEKHPTEYLATPTLHELIEACGEDFRYLIRDVDGWRTWGVKIIPKGKYSTPEEAVANLWLALKNSSV